MDYLPDDILTQILVKVPCHKSILRCTSVCKPWSSLIKSPAFFNFHLHCPDKPKYLLCDYNNSRSARNSNRQRYLSIHHDTETLVEHNTLVSFNKLRHSGMSIHGCCNGLIFYTLGVLDLPYLWNPTIRKEKALPRYRDRGTAYEFWFDKRMNDYMVAKITQGFCDVYSLSTNSWRNITAKIPINLLVQTGGELAYVDGTLHWPAQSSSGWMICSLDIESGMLRKTMITETNPWGTVFSLKPLGEHSFAVVKSKIVAPYVPRHCCTVQVYDQNVNILYTIDLEKDTHHKLYHMAGLRNNGEALFTKSGLNDSGIISWNPKTKDIKEFIPEVTVPEALDGSYHHDHAYYRLSRVRPFVETLALLKDGVAERISTPNDHPTYKEKIEFFLCVVCIGFVLCTLLFATILCFK